MRRDQSAGRVAALRGRLVDLELDGVVITTLENIRYLSGFSGSLGYLVIGRTDAEILGDSRYWLQMEAPKPRASRSSDPGRRTASGRWSPSVSRPSVCAGSASSRSI